MLKGAEEKFGPCKIKVLRVSGMTRAQETAEIIASHLPTVEFALPDPLLNEGRLVWNEPYVIPCRFVEELLLTLCLSLRPSHHIPSSPATDKIIEGE
jgi:hypothetical protein